LLYRVVFCLFFYDLVSETRLVITDPVDPRYSSVLNLKIYFEIVSQDVKGLTGHISLRVVTKALVC
jgi:hypothetical protein